NGDRDINLLITEYLLKKVKININKLPIVLITKISNINFAYIVRKLNLENYVYMSNYGDKLLGSIFEAIICTFYNILGFKNTKKIVFKLLDKMEMTKWK